MLEYAKNETQNRVGIDQHDSDVTYFIYVSVGVLILFMIYVIIQYRTKRLCGCCIFRRDIGDLLPRIHLVTPETGSDFVSTVSIISDILIRISKRSPPPPYEHPPPYHVAVKIERENSKY